MAQLKGGSTVGGKLIETSQSVNSRIIQALSLLQPSDINAYTKDQVDSITGILSSLNTTSKTNIVGAVNEISLGLGNLNILNTNNKSSAVSSINELILNIGNITTLSTTSKTNLVNAINEIDLDIGNLSSLTTNSKTSITTAINELDLFIGDLTSLTTITKSTLVGAINELVKAPNSQSWIATDGQTVFVLQNNATYPVGSKSLDIYVSGIKQIADLNFNETNNTTFTLSEGVSAGTLIEAKWYQGFIPSIDGHNATHRKGGTDELPITSLFGYDTNIGDTSILSTTSKNVVGAINELFNSSYIIMVTSLPTPSSGLAGFTRLLKGTSGNPDSIHICMKLADGTYNWVQIV